MVPRSCGIGFGPEDGITEKCRVELGRTERSPGQEILQDTKERKTGAGSPEMWTGFNISLTPLASLIIPWTAGYSHRLQFTKAFSPPHTETSIPAKLASNMFL